MSEERQTQEKNRSKEIEPSQVLTPDQARSLGLTVEPGVVEVLVYGAIFEVLSFGVTDEVMFVKKYLGRISGTFSITELILAMKAYKEQL